MIQNSGSTQPSKPIQKSGRGRAFLFNLLGVIIILALVVLGGYQSGISIRKQNQSTVMTRQLSEQFQFAVDDIQAKRYDNARQRLEFILSNDPAYPGVQDKLTEVLVLMNAPTPSPVPSLTPTPDFSGAEQAFARAQQLTAAQDWPGTLSALDQMRKLDPTYQQSQVDGMYFFALRNYGYDLITKQGNLEGGIYQLTLAERFGILDNNAKGIREGARYYIIGASFWELDWGQTVSYFDQVRTWGNLWDGTMTASERYWYASMRRGDELFAKGQYCDAVGYYQNAEAIATLDKTANSNFNDAYQTCFPATETPSPIPLASPTIDASVATTAPTDTVVPPTDTPISPTP